MSIEVNPDDISFFWKGFNDRLKDFVKGSIDNMINLPKQKYNDKKKLFNEAKD